MPPSFQTKKFVNDDIGPYYQFYEDDKYFMKKAGEFAEEVRKKIKGATARDVASAIFYYITMKSMLPTRSIEKKKFTPALLVKFLKAKRMTLKNMSEKLSDFDEEERGPSHGMELRHQRRASGFRFNLFPLRFRFRWIPG